MNSKQNIASALAGSGLFKEYEKAFTEATGLPLALNPVDSWHLPLRDKKNENPFCAAMGNKSVTCAGCLQTQQQLAEAAMEQPKTLTCAHGMWDTAVPVRVGNQLIAYLQTGQVFVKKPTPAQFERSLKLITPDDSERDHLRQLYFQTRVMGPRQYESMVKMLTIFAQHLSILSNQLVVQNQNSEPTVIVRAKEFIQDHFSEELSLGQVAKSVNSSPFYFCKVFKKATGINFTEFLARVRVEKAKNLLLNPNLRISEIAFEVGFQSLTHFNRVFKKVLGQSPTEYRSNLQIPVH